MIPRSLTSAGFCALDSDDVRYPHRVHRLQRRDSDYFGLPVAMEHKLTGIVLLLIPGGGFRVGARESDLLYYKWEKPVHRRKLRPFYLGQSPVTQEQWRRAVRRNPSRFRGIEKPVESVSFGDAREFLRLAGSNLRLPYEDEWERAARGGTDTVYWWGNEFEPAPVNCLGGKRRREGPGGTTEVTPAVSNPFGLLDILGNVWEWVGDGGDSRRYGYGFGGDAWKAMDPSMRVVCGGSWRDSAALLRCSERMAWAMDDRQPFIGFRVARDVSTVEQEAW